MPQSTKLEATPVQVATSERSRRARDLGLIILFTASGASGLMLEVVWTRMLGWSLGATTWSVMTILVAYLGGLGLGGIIWGLRAPRALRPLRLFGWLECAIGLYTLAVPGLFGWLGRLLVTAGPLVGDTPAAAVVVRVIAAALALGLPTLLMGGTLPVLTQFAAAGRPQPGRIAGALYAANTAGAVLGCFVTGCWLIFWLGVIETNVLAAVIDLGVGVAALAWDRGLVNATVGGSFVATPASSRAPARMPLLIAAASGFCALAYELLWTRSLLAAVTDDTTYAFTLMLTAFLAGSALGAAMAGRSGGGQSPERDWRRLGTAQMMAAACALVSVPLLVVIRDPISRESFTEGMTFWGARILFHLVISLAVFAPSAFFLGNSFVLAARLYVGPSHPVGQSIGRLYGLNTLCAVLGAIVTTAFFIPALGAQFAIVALAVFQAALGAGVILFCGVRPTTWRGRANSAGALSLLVAWCCVLNYFAPLSGIYARQEPGRLLALVEGRGAAITVHQRNAADRVISINGVNVAGTNNVLRATQKLQAHLPVCLHPGPRSVLQIGFGSGGTCYSVSLHDEIKSIDVVELNPDVLEVASDWFADINHRVLRDPRVRVRIADAKSYVAATTATYDLILSDSTHPRFRGNAALYTRDYFDDCSRRLRPGGFISTWLPLYGMSTDDIRGILKSFHSVFPHVQVWYANSEPHENTIVIASKQPIAIDPGALGRRLAVTVITDDLAEVGIISTTQLLDYFMLGDRAVAEFARTGRLNTDDHPRLEFLAPRSLRRKQSWIDNFDALRQAREPIAPYLVNAGKDERERLARWHAGTTWKLAGQARELESMTAGASAFAKLADALKAYDEGVRSNPDDFVARSRLDKFRRAFALARPPDRGHEEAR
jgi:spermidine synthase